MQRGRAAAVIGERDVLKGERGRVRRSFLLRFGREGRRLALPLQNRLDALFAGDRLGDGEDEVCEFDQLHQNDGEIAVERDDVALQ